MFSSIIKIVSSLFSEPDMNSRVSQGIMRLCLLLGVLLFAVLNYQLSEVKKGYEEVTLQYIVANHDIENLRRTLEIQNRAIEKHKTTQADLHRLTTVYNTLGDQYDAIYLKYSQQSGECVPKEYLNELVDAFFIVYHNLEIGDK